MRKPSLYATRESANRPVQIKPTAPATACTLRRQCEVRGADAREEIRNIVDANPDFELGEQVGHDGGEEADGNGERSADEASSGRDGDEPGDRASAEADDAPLSRDPVVHQHPRDAGNGSGEVCVHDRERGLEIGGESRSAVAVASVHPGPDHAQAEPADPEKRGTEHDVRDRVRCVGQAIRSVSSALAEDN